ncbi:unnamed protein product [Owenia fusiformis]|uniref:Uncharacterized protein n=1 Tax=Owenia fusiformis TaxID=6347 RepID=A0A8J1U271_OWEFU|nr:unnamed protein product [Owenia fusiformis]
MASKKTKSDPWVRVFDVSEPHTHEKGFTIYKVTYRVFPLENPENVTEVILWRRYNDFKKLYRTLFTLHKKLQRREEFPAFAPAKMFGRFEGHVIEDRVRAMIDLLYFAGRQPHLFNSQAFKKFFEGGEKRKRKETDTLKDGILQPQYIQPERESTSTADDSDSEISSVISEPIGGDHISRAKAAGQRKSSGPLSGEACLIPKVQVSDTTNQPDGSHDSLLPRNMSDTNLGGVWKYRQAGDNISINSAEGDLPVEDSNSMLPQSDLLNFDPMTGGCDLEGSGVSNTWLLSAMNQLDNPNSTGVQGASKGEPPPPEITIQCSTPRDRPQTITFKKPSTTPENNSPNVDLKQAFEDAFGPIKSRSEPKVECGKGDLPFGFVKGKNSSPNLSPMKLSPRSSPRQARKTESDDYLLQAANQISAAKDCEAAGNYQVAFGYYKNGVSILLKGVQGDSNEARLDAVRKKTAQYLLKAESLYKTHIAKQEEDEKRWASNSSISPSVEIDPAVAHIQGPVSELRNYRVLGLIDKCMLTLDRSTQATFVLKVLHKTAPSTETKTIVPRSCPYMVEIYKFYETESSIYLLLHHASGGKLWSYVSAYLGTRDKEDALETAQIDSNVYQGQKMETIEEPPLDVSAKTSSPFHSPEGSPSHPMSDTSEGGDACTSYVDLFTDYSQTNIEPNAVAFSKGLAVKFDTQISHDDDTFLSPEEMSELNDTSGFPTTPTKYDSDSAFNNTSTPHKFSDILNGAVTKQTANFSIASIDSGSDRLCSESSEQYATIPETDETNTIESHIQTIEDNDSNVNVNNMILNDGLESIEPPHNLNIVESKTNETSNTETPSDVNCEVVSSTNTSNANNSNVEHNANSPNIVPTDLESPYHEDTLTSSANQIPNVSPIHKPSTIESVTLSGQNELKSAVDNTNTKPPEECSLQLDLSFTKTEQLEVIDKNTDIPESDRSTPERKFIDRQISNDELKVKITDVGELKNLSHIRTTSVELGLEQPSPRTRARTLSAAFGQLDLAGSDGNRVKLPEACVRQWAAEIIVAVDHLHSRGIICMDLHPDNILLGERGHVMLTYFCEWRNVDRHIPQWTIDQLYVAPEVMTLGAHTHGADWWSVGALLYELLTGQSLLACHPGGIGPHTAVFIPDYISTEAQGLLTELLRYSVSERLGSGINGVDDIKMHPFFADIQWETLRE